MNTILLIIILQLGFIMVTDATKNKTINNQERLICQPADSTLCAGWRTE